MADPNAALISEPDGTPADQTNTVYYPSGINILILPTITGREHHHKNLHLLRDGQPETAHKLFQPLHILQYSVCAYHHDSN